MPTKTNPKAQRPATQVVSPEIFKQVYDSPLSLPGKCRWVTKDEGVRTIEKLLGIPEQGIAPLGECRVSDVLKRNEFMSRERWGTFSVADHLRPRAFVAEVLLYDRLVIPCPLTAEERARWTGLRWEPEQLDHKLEILGDEMTIRVPWDQWRQERYRTRLAAARHVNYDGINVLNEQGKVDPFHMTRMILAQDCRPELPKGVAKVWALAAYPSFNAYQEDENQKTREEQREKLAMVLTHQFLVPEDRGKSDDEMLKKAVELAKRDDFKEKRSKFHRWQEDIIEKEIPESKAVEEMEEYLGKYNGVVKQATKDVYWKYAFMVIPVAVGIATAPLGAPLVIAGATGLLSVAAFAKFERRPKIDAGECEAAAIIHDIQKNFNWA